MKPEVLVINSYGGSLTLACQQQGHPIIASCEDHNFGLDSQRLNFPHLNYRSELADWDLDLDLRDKMVIAHPPCSAFSSQNRGKNTRGAGSAAFSCTTRLLEYVMPRRPEAIMIESVPGALEGARHVHDHYAQHWGYDLYRVLQNACSFGVPQWRRRFWAIFVKQAEGRKREFTFRLHHQLSYLGDVFDMNAEENTAGLDPGCIGRWRAQVERLKDLGYTEESLRQMLTECTTYTNLVGILAEKQAVAKTRGWPPFGWLHDKVIGGNFLSGALHVLNPNSFAPVLLGPCWWWLGKRQLEVDDYKQIMGFPRDYQYHKPRMTFVLLSKGVCPPVARWILRETTRNVFGIQEDEAFGTDIADPEHLVFQTIQPGEVANMQPPRAWQERHVSQPELVS